LNTFIKRPFALIGFSLLFSSITIFLLPSEAHFYSVGLLIAFCAVLTFIKPFTAKYLIIFTFCFIVSSLTINYFYRCVYNPSLQLDSQLVHIEGTATGYSSENENCRFVTVKNCEINGNATSLCVELYYYSDLEISPYDTVSFDATLYKKDLSGKFEAHALSEKVWFTAFASNRISVHKNGDFHIYRYIIDLSEHLKEILFTFLPFDSASVAAALLLGDKSFVPEEFTDNFRYSGVSHIFAVSGMHLSLWSALLFIVLRKRSKTKFIPNIIASLFVVFYIALTGFSPSVIRAGIMLLFVYLSRVLRRTSDTLNSLGLAITLILIHNPLMAGNVSFLLSLLATAAICFASSEITSDITPYNFEDNYIKGKFKSITGSILTTLTVLFFTIPVSGFFFGCISLVSPISNLLCSLPAQFAMISSFLGIIVSPFPTIARYIFFIADFCISYITDITGKLAQADFTLIPVTATYITVWYVFCVISVLLTYFFFGKKLKRCVTVLLCCCVLVITAGIVNQFISRNDINVYIPQGENAPVCISASMGANTILIGCSEDYKAIQGVNSFMYMNASRSADYLFVTDEKTTTEEFNETVKIISPENIITVNETFGNAALITNSFTAEIQDNFYLSFENNKVFSVVYFEINSYKFVYCLNPFANYTALEAQCKNADYLICTRNIPDTINAENYKNIIVISPKSAVELSLPENAVSTADGEIRIRLKGD